MRSSYLVRGVIDGCVFLVTQNFTKRNSALKEVKLIFKQVDSSAEHFFLIVLLQTQVGTGAARLKC